MASKNFANMLNKPVRTNVNTTETKKAAAPKTTVAPAKAAEPVRAKGRPVKDEAKGKKRDYCKTINIAVPKDTLEQISEFAMAARGISLTDYVNLLIAQDLEKNLAKYKKEINRHPDFD